jgi:hypothetical protein
MEEGLSCIARSFGVSFMGPETLCGMELCGLVRGVSMHRLNNKAFSARLSEFSWSCSMQLRTPHVVASSLILMGDDNLRSSSIMNLIFLEVDFLTTVSLLS